MKTIYNIARTELQTLFFSPIAWLILIIFTFHSSMAFADVMGGMVRNQALGYGLRGVTLGVYASPWGGLFPIELNEPGAGQRFYKITLFFSGDQHSDHFRKIPFHDDLCFGFDRSVDGLCSFHCFYG